MKVKYTLVFSIVSFFMTTIVFSQELSDQEIGFDVTRTTMMLKEHGVKEQDLASEIIMMRKTKLQQHVGMKKVEESISNKIAAKQSTKVGASFTSNAAQAAFVDISQTERAALIAFYNSTDGPNWKNTKGNNKAWDINNPISNVSTWYGVIVVNGSVYSLNLSNNKLVGTIPSEIGDLKSLQYLQLGSNELTGGIPTQIGDLTALTTLELQYNKFSGSITEIGKLTSLKILNLGSNQFSGNIVFSEIKKLTSLTNLDLSFNQFSGNIAEIENLNNLTILTLRWNKFSGSVAEIGKLTTLWFLDLFSNQFSGSIPEIGNLTSLSTLNLGSNRFSGDITELGKLTSLTSLELSNNGFSGSIAEIGKLTRLMGLDLRSNQFSGSIDEIGKLTSLTDLKLFSNKLTGSITELGKLTKLTSLVIQGNQFSGTIPSQISQFVGLRTFYFDGNKFRFVNFVNEFEAFKLKLGSNFHFSPQAKINQAETITKYSGESVNLKMFADGDIEFHSLDTYKWFKNGNEISGAIGNIYTISSVLTEDEGTYICRSYHVTDPDMSPLVLEREPITLKVVPCTSTVAGTVIASPANPTVNVETNFSLETTASGLTYEWTFYNLDNTEKAKVTTAQASQIYTIPGTYNVKLVVADFNGCKTNLPVFTVTVIDSCIPIIGIVKSFPASPIVNVKTNFSLETAATGLTYAWTFFDLDNTTVIANSSAAQVSQTYSLGGTYNVELIVKDTKNCSRTFKSTVVIEEACTPIVGVIKIISPSSPSCEANVTATPGSQTILSGEVTAISLSSTKDGTSFTWTVNQTGLTGATSGSGNTIKQTLIKTGTANGEVVYKITPWLGGCSGKIINVIVNAENKSFKNNAKSGSFTKDNCSGGIPSTVTYTVVANTHTSIISQADADAKAEADVTANGQAYANSTGTCTFKSIAYNGSFTRDNCMPEVGSSVNFSLPIGAVTSTLSQMDADTKGMTKFKTEGQAYANANGTCISCQELSASIEFSEHDPGMCGKLTFLDCEGTTKTLYYENSITITGSRITENIKIGCNATEN